MTKPTQTWWWIFWGCLVKAGNPRGAAYWAKDKLISEGWLKNFERCETVQGAWWDHDRWGWTWLRKLKWMLHNGWWYNRCQILSRWFHDREMWELRNLFNVYQGGDRWEWPWQPRTCSHDGGVHPEDAIRLIQEGWTCEGTTKAYKRYLEPPPVGFKTFEEAYPHLFMRALCDFHKRDVRGDRVPVRSWSPVPPVKLYTIHFTEEQRTRFNRALSQQAEKERTEAYAKAMKA